MLARTNCDNTAMSFDQYFATAAADSAKASHGFFDCNICLDLAHDPVVTLCGHLYCWSCMYKWFHYQSASLASDERPQCPVCKAEVTHTTVVPLYGRGQTPSSEAEPEPEPEGKAPYGGIAVPNRPPALGTQILKTTPSHVQQLPYRNPYQNPHFPPQAYNDHEEDSSPPLYGARGSTTVDPSNLVVRMFGEMVYARVFGNSESLYTSNSYHQVPSSNPRLRRQTMQANKFLCRISLFLFCCLPLCLVLF